MHDLGAIEGLLFGAFVSTGEPVRAGACTCAGPLGSRLQVQQLSCVFTELNPRRKYARQRLCFVPVLLLLVVAVSTHSHVPWCCTTDERAHQAVCLSPVPLCTMPNCTIYGILRFFEPS